MSGGYNICFSDLYEVAMFLGLAFCEDLSHPVTLEDAKLIRDKVFEIASHLLPGVTVTLSGGFRR